MQLTENHVVELENRIGEAWTFFPCQFLGNVDFFSTQTVCKGEVWRMHDGHFEGGGTRSDIKGMGGAIWISYSKSQASNFFATLFSVGWEFKPPMVFIGFFCKSSAHFCEKNVLGPTRGLCMNKMTPNIWKFWSFGHLRPNFFVFWSLEWQISVFLLILKTGKAKNVSGFKPGKPTKYAHLTGKDVSVCVCVT